MASRAWAGQDRAVTDESRSPLENALDLFVYAPVGLALTAAEELPKLAEKGRAQVQGQITIARMVGQFALAQGRKQIERRLGANGRPASQTAQPTPPSPAPAPVRRAEPTVSKVQAPPPEPDSDGGYTKLSGRSNDVASPSAGAPGVASAPSGGAAVGGPTVVPPPTPGPSADQLAIPGYDSLSASQVVQRLAGLSRDELEAVGAYESAHRARRTILTRVNQLKG